MTPPRLPATALVACAMLMTAAPCRGQGPGQPGGPPSAPFAFGVTPGDGGTQPSYGQPPGFAPPGGYNPQPFAPQPALQPSPFPPAGPPMVGQPSQQQLQQLADAERQDFGVPAPRQLHAGAPHAPTPNTLPGGQVITTLGLLSLLQQPGLQPVLLDALGGQAHLPGALPAVFAAQPGTFNDGVQQQLAGLLQQATNGDRTRPVVVYCSDPHCWMSYNAAMRAVALGYRNVLWYRGGLWAWQQAGLPTGALGTGPGAAPGMPAGLGGGPGPAMPPARSGFRQDGPVQGGGGQGGGGQGGGRQGVAFTMGDLGQAVTYGRDRDWTTSASPDGALVLANPDNPSGWLVDTVRQPGLPFTMEMEVASGIGAKPGAALGAGPVFAYSRGQGSESFYTLLLAGNMAVLYHRHDGTFDEVSRTSTAGGGRATVRITVQQDGFSYSINGNGVVSQDADGPMTGRFGVMASGVGQAAFRNLRLQ